MERLEPRTLLERLIQESDRTLGELCEDFERCARENQERAATLSVRQLSRWMAGQVDNARPASRRVARHLWGHSFKKLVGPPGASVEDAEDSKNVASENSSFGFSVTELEALEELRATFRNWASIGNGALARKAVIAQLNEVIERLREAPQGPLTDRAFRLAAGLARVVASMSYDAGLHLSAQRYYMTSVQLAKIADDKMLAAVALADLARQSYDLGRPGDGLEIVQLAQYGTRKLYIPRLRSLLATREAWAYAQRGEKQAFHRAVGLAEDHFSEGAAEDEPDSVRDFDAAELAGVIGARYRDLARHDSSVAQLSVRYIEQAVERREPSRTRNRTFDLIGLARTYVITGEPEHACELVGQVISVARKWSTGRVGTKLGDLYCETEQYKMLATVRETRDTIDDLLSLTGKDQKGSAGATHRNYRPF